MRRRDIIALLGGAVALPMARPLAARAQQRALPVIGYLSGGTESGFATQTEAFRQGLREQGYVEGRNVEILYRWADERRDRLPALAADLVRRRVAVIVATGGSVSTIAAKSATATIPIVSTSATDPVYGVVASLNRPGGNITGASILTETLTAKRLELLHEIVPATTSIGFLFRPGGEVQSPGSEVQRKEAEGAARILGLRLTTIIANTPGEIDAAFAKLAGQQIGGSVVDAEPLYFEQRTQIAILAARHAMPAIYYASTRERKF